MGSPLVPLALAGAAVVLLASGKKRKKSEAGAGTFLYSHPKPAAPPVYGGGAIPEDAPGAQSNWVERQKALQWISEIRFTTQDGGSVPLCGKCHPGAADGKPGKKTRAAIKAFQAIAGLDVDGEWDLREDLAMDKIVAAVMQDLPISCDPLVGYPAPFACFVQDGGDFGLMLIEGTKGVADESAVSPKPKPPAPAPSPSEAQKEYGPDELLVADAECNYILHQDMKWFDEQKRRAIGYALNGMTDSQAANEIHESMLADYIPLCLSLGRNSVGPGVKQFWDQNLAHVANMLKGYELLPETLEQDAIEMGLL